MAPARTTASGYILRPDGTIVQEMLDEANMGDPQTMVDFVRWGQQQAPADHYYLALADHANSLDGIAWDATSSPTEQSDQRRAASGAAGDHR